MEDRPKRIKGELLPFDAQDMEPLLAELVRHDFILRYRVDGVPYIQILRFVAHQAPHYSEKPSVIPAPDFRELTPDHEASIPGNSAHDEASTPGELRKVVPIKRGSQPPDSLIPDSQNVDSRALADKPPKKAGNRRIQLPDDFTPDVTGLLKASNAGIPMPHELEKFKDYHRAKGNTMADWQAAWRTWVGNAVDYAKRNGKGKGNGFTNARDESRKRTVRGLTGYDPDAIEGVSTRTR